MWQELAGYARWAPSPHNTQPVRLRVIDAERAEVLFVTERGLSVGDPEGRFTYVTFGIFIESLRIAAHARGHELEASHLGEPLYADDRPRRKVADLRLRARDDPVEDFDRELLLRRRTNRHPYNDRPVPPGVIGELRELAREHGHTFGTSTDAQAIRWVKELNRDSLYHDLEHEAYRRELDSWLRYSDAEALRSGDGLSPSAMVLPGWLMRGMMRYHWVLAAPGLRRLTQRLYMRTMTGISTVGWVQGDFSSAEDWIRAGRLMLRLWLVLTRHGIDWQPYGSVITNPQARGAMVDKFDIREGDRGQDMAWLLARMGYCDRAPARSARLPLEEILS